MEEQQNSHKNEEDNKNQEDTTDTSLNNQIKQETPVDGTENENLNSNTQVKEKIAEEVLSNNEENNETERESNKSLEVAEDTITNYLDDSEVENHNTQNNNAEIGPNIETKPTSENIEDNCISAITDETKDNEMEQTKLSEENTNIELKDNEMGQTKLSEEKTDIGLVENEHNLSTLGLSSEETLPTIGGSDEKLDQNTDKLGRNINTSIKISLELQPQKAKITADVVLAQTLNSLAESLSEQIKIPVDVIGFVYKGETIENSTTFFELGITEDELDVIEVSSLQPEKHSIYLPDGFSQNSNFITVRIDKGEGQYEDVKVHVEAKNKKKPFLGGFKHKVTGVQYHNASAQTNPKPLRWPKTTLFNRDAQTVFERKQFTQTTNTTSTQMTKPGIYVSVLEDKVIEARPYFTADHWLQLRYDAVIVLQRNWRRWLAVQYCNRLRDARDRRLDWEQNEEEKKRMRKEELMRKDIERRTNPKCKEDFDLVYAALEKWRREELANINMEMLDEPTRKAALCALLEQHSQLIASIGQHKNQADKLNKESAIQKLLNKAAAPHKWRAYDGKTTEMDTQNTIRAKEMRDLYNSIILKYLSQDERLDVLLTLKHTVKEFDCNLTRDIIELIDREADLIMRGVSDKNLEGLRKRIATLFLQFCKNPAFNPEVAKHLKVPPDHKVLKKNIFYCNSTQKYLHSSNYDLGSNSNTAGRSKNANDLDNIARKREDNLKYKQMLITLRRDENKYNDDSNIALVFQEKELQYLVETIWMSSSIISAWDDVRDLKFVRWVTREPWSPWNCILVTKDEAIAHQRITNLHKAYGEVFINKVHHKHTIAKAYFRKIPQLSRLFTEQSSSKQKRRALGGAQEMKGRNTCSTR